MGSRHMFPCLLAFPNRERFPKRPDFIGLTKNPSQMALAHLGSGPGFQAGETLGREFKRTGFTFYLGRPGGPRVANSEAADYLGTETFGGRSLWVGVMGNAVISGYPYGQ